MTVISLAAARQERQPHWSGECVCLACRHEWTGVGAMGEHVSLECPECTLPKGVTKYPFRAAAGDLLFTCLCGCEAMTVYKRKLDGLFVTKCMACGADQTAAIYGDAP